jgi:hypothetical protein
MKRLTRKQAAVIGAYTGILVGRFSDVHKYIEELAGRPVFTHEMANKEFANEIKAKAERDFVALVAR